MIKKALFFLTLVLILGSCASNKNIHYLYNSSAAEQSSANYENTLQPDDNLIIIVTSDEPVLANEFNLLYLNARSTEAVQITNNELLFTYLIDSRGEIDFPVLGKIKLGGLTRIQSEEKIKELLKKHIINPGVNLRVVNFKVSVLGEVVRPGPQRVVGDRITILEALSGAGDLTIYGNRKDVMVIREKDGVQTVNTVDITDPELIKSPYYFLAHNDVVYIKPNKTRVNSSVIGPNITIGISALSLIVTIIALSIK